MPKLSSKQRLRKQRREIRDSRRNRYFDSLIEAHTDKDGSVDFTGLNKQLQSDNKNPSWEEFFDVAINQND